ncbi:DUF2690 domain-containing protein [Streptomyces sp. NPDC006743]|uniref:DUF2690 domain-containing protein n=1 Tax=Streptomyces sp. NPDC006743 TaxID=3154480 RepID=UPI0034529929
MNGVEAKGATANGVEAKGATANGVEAHGGRTRNGRTDNGRTNGGRANGGKANGGKVRVPRWGSAQTPGGLLAGIAGPAGVSPTVPPQPTASDADARERGVGEREAREREARAQGPRATAPASGSRTGADGDARTAPGAAPAAGSRAGTAATSVVKSSAGAQGTHGDADADTDAVTDSDSESVSGSGSGADSGSPAGPAARPAPKVNSWGVAGYRGPAPMGGKRESGGAATAPGVEPPPPPPPAAPTPGTTAAAVPAAATAAVPGTRTAATPGAGTGVSPTAAPAPALVPASAPAPAPSGMFRRQLAMFFAGMAVTLLVIGVVFYFTGGFGGTRTGSAAASPSPSATTGPSLPPGVKCAGDGCTGKDAEAMGCSGERGTTDRSVTVGTTLVEVRYSKTCGAAWGRITQASQGDEVKVTVGTRTRSDTLATPGDTIAYTPMLPVKDAAQATVCVTLATGQQGCTR